MSEQEAEVIHLDPVDAKLAKLTKLRPKVLMVAYMLDDGWHTLAAWREEIEAGGRVLIEMVGAAEVLKHDALAFHHSLIAEAEDEDE